MTEIKEKFPSLFQHRKQLVLEALKKSDLLSVYKMVLNNVYTALNTMQLHHLLLNDKLINQILIDIEAVLEVK